jgi:hypothetical protein
MKVVYTRHQNELYQIVFDRIHSELAEAVLDWEPGSYDEYDMIDVAIDTAEGFNGVTADYAYVDAIQGCSSPNPHTVYRAPFEIYIGDEAYEQDITFIVYG